MTAADLYEVLSAFLMSPVTAIDEGAMLPVTTVTDPARTDTKQRTAPPKKTAALRCPTKKNSTALISASIITRGTYWIDQNSEYLLLTSA